MNNTLLNLTPEQFCDITNACAEGRKYALTQPDMAAVWDNCPRAVWLLWIVKRIRRTNDDKTLLRFAVWCVRETPLADGRKVFDLLTDERSQNAVVVAEKYAIGDATDQELDAARAAARAAAWAAAEAAARAAAWAAAEAAARDAAGAAVWDAARAAAWAAAQPAAWAAAWAAAEAHQVAHLRTLFENPFKEAKP